MGIGQVECLHNGFVGVNKHAGTGPALQYAIVSTRICSAVHFYFRGSGARSPDGHVPWFR